MPWVQERCLLKKLNLATDERKPFEKTRKLIEHGDCQGFCEIQIAMSSIRASKKKNEKSCMVSEYSSKGPDIENTGLIHISRHI